MFKKLWSKVGNKKVGSVLLILVMLAMVVLQQAPRLSNVHFRDMFTIGTVESAGVADATCDGAADDVQAQTLVTALPATGGRVYILTGTYVWTNGVTVTDASPAITISGTGYGTYITASDGVTSPFTAGNNNWVLENMRFNVTTATLLTAMGATTGWEWHNVTTSDGYFSYEDGTLTGRCADVVAINSTLVALNALGVAGSRVYTLEMAPGNYVGSVSVVAQSWVNVEATGVIITITNNVGGGYPFNNPAIDFNNIINSTWNGLTIYRDGAMGGAQDTCAGAIRGNSTDATCIVRNCKFINRTTGGLQGLCGLIVGCVTSASPRVENCTGQGSLNATANSTNNGIAAWGCFETPGDAGYGTPFFTHCTGIGGLGGNGVMTSEVFRGTFEYSRGIAGTASGLDSGNGWWLDEDSGTFISCYGEVSQLTGYGQAWSINGGQPYLKDCIGVFGTSADGDRAFDLNGNCSAILEDCIGYPKQEPTTLYIPPGVTTGTSRPFAGSTWVLPSKIGLYTASDQAGKTVDIGTTLGGNEIANGVSLAGAGMKWITVPLTSMAINAYVYLTISAPLAENLALFYTGIYANDGYCVNVNTTGNARITGGSFTQVKSPNTWGVAVFIQGSGLTNLNWRIDGAHIETVGGLYAIMAYLGTIYDPPIHGCTIIGGVSGIPITRLMATIDQEITIGQYFFNNISSTTGQGAAINVMYATPLWIPTAVTIDRIAIEVTTAEVASHARLGIYYDNGAMSPTGATLVVDGGAVDTTAIGVKTVTVSVQLQRGLYWVVVVPETNALAFRRLGDDSSGWLPLGISASGFNNASGRNKAVAQAYGALPATFPVAPSTGIYNGYIIPVRIASINAIYN